MGRDLSNKRRPTAWFAQSLVKKPETGKPTERGSGLGFLVLPVIRISSRVLGEATAERRVKVHTRDICVEISSEHRKRPGTWGRQVRAFVLSLAGILEGAPHIPALSGPAFRNTPDTPKPYRS